MANRSNVDIWSPNPVAGGDGMLNCTQNYNSSGQQAYNAQNIRSEKVSTSSTTSCYTTCYNPEKTDSNLSCHKDRNGNTLYSCFPTVGETEMGCRSSCVSGTNQDYNRTLYNNNFNEKNLYCAERGVELYENYGLDTNIRSDNGNYGAEGNNSFACVTEMGRKVTIFGNTNFYVAPGYSFLNDNIISNFTVNSNSGNFVTPVVGGNVIIPDSGVFYVIQFLLDSTYIGNHGVIFEVPQLDGSLKTYNFIYGYIQDIPNYVGYTIIDDTKVRYYINPVGFISNMGDIAGIDIGQTISTDCSSSVRKGQAPFPGSFAFNYSTADCGPGHKDPGPTNHPYACSASGVRSMYIPPHMEVKDINFLSSSNGKISSGPNYTSYSNDYVYYYINALSAAANHGVKISLPIRYSSSRYKNGTFHCMQGTSPGYAAEAIGSVYTNYTISNLDNGLQNPGNPDYLPAPGNSTSSTLPIPACTIYGIQVRMRTDSDFYNTYVNPYRNYFAPEIFLIPGIENAQQFTANLDSLKITFSSGRPVINNPNPILNRIQTIKRVNNLWTSENPYFDSYSDKYIGNNSPYTLVDPNYWPGDTIYSSGSVVPPKKITVPPNWQGPVKTNPTGTPFNCGSTGENSFFQKTDKLLISANNSIDRVVKTVNNTINKLVRIKPLPTFDTKINNQIDQIENNASGVYPVAKPLGSYRIKFFEPTNYLMSLEWLYVLFYCAYNGGNTNVQYNSNSNTYSYCTNTGDSNSTCQKECMLFRDPFFLTNQNQTKQLSASDYFIKTFCGMRNISFLYARWEPDTSINTNFCTCMNNGQCGSANQTSICPTTGNLTSTDKYVPDSLIIGQNCNAVCTSCKINAIQIFFAKYGCNMNNNGNITLDVNCGNCVDIDVGGDNGGNNGGDGGNNGGDGGNNGGSSGGSSGGNSGGIKDQGNKDTETGFLESHIWIIILIILIIVIVIAVIVVISYKKYYKQ